jgi:hypothetical protein
MRQRIYQVGLGVDVITVNQMLTNRRSAAKATAISLLASFLILLMKTKRSLEIFQLQSLCHIKNKVEVYKALNALTQRYKSQKFGHVLTNSTEPSRFMWCGIKHLHKDSPEKMNSALTLKCCIFQLADRQTAHPSSLYLPGLQTCEGERQRRKCQKKSNSTTGGLFSKFTTTALLFAEALRDNPEQNKRTYARKDALTYLNDTELSINNRQQARPQSELQT